MYSVYWATTTITTVGYGDVVAVASSERIYNILVFVLGTSVYALVKSDQMCVNFITSN